MRRLIQVLLPGHLGDAVLTLAAVEALLGEGEVNLEGPPFVSELFAHLPVRFGWSEEADTAVLFKPSFGAAWRARRHPRRVGLATDGRWPLLTEALLTGNGHRIDDYSALALAAGALSVGLPAFPTRPAPPLRGHELLLPGSRSGATVQWPGFRAHADRLVAAGVHVIFAGGPDEIEAVRLLAGPHPVLASTSLHDIASMAARVDRVVGNDAGLSHLAAAARRGAGVSVADVHILCGSTDPRRTAAPGATTWVAPVTPPCWPCYQKSCRFGLPCLDFDPFVSSAQGAG